MNRFTNALPPAGGATGAMIEGSLQIGSIIDTIILAAIGAVVGWCIKVLLDYLYSKYGNRNIKKV